MSQNTIMFIFDRVVHYHKPLFKALEDRYPKQLFLLSGEVPKHATGRVGTKEKVINNEYKYGYNEIKIRNFILRKANFFHLVKNIKPNIIIIPSHIGNISFWKLIKLKKLLKFKLIAWQCGYEYNRNPLKDILLRRFINGFDYQLAYHTNARKYAEYYGANPDTITVIHNTIDETKISTTTKGQARDILQRTHLDITNKKIVLFVGAILKEKKIELLIEALDIMNRIDVLLFIVGNGPHLPHIKALCNGRNDIILTGNIVNGVGNYFDAADVFVLPGTGGLGINEAMKHSLPIISGYADGSADDLVIDNINGYRMTSVTPKSIADKINLIINNPLDAQKMGKISFEMITGKYSFNNFLNRVFGVLDNIS